MPRLSALLPAEPLQQEPDETHEQAMGEVVSGGIDDLAALINEVECICVPHGDVDASAEAGAGAAPSIKGCTEKLASETCCSNIEELLRSQLRQVQSDLAASHTRMLNSILPNIQPMPYAEGDGNNGGESTHAQPDVPAPRKVQRSNTFFGRNGVRQQAAQASTRPTTASNSHCFEVLELWKQEKPNLDRSRPRLGSATLMNNVSLQWFDTNHQNAGRFVLHPNDLKRTVWEMIGVVFVAYDVIVLPLAFFDPPFAALRRLGAWTTRLFWTFDLPMNFLVGFVSATGQIQLEQKRIIERYLTTWFALDVFMVGLDWMEGVGTAILGDTGPFRSLCLLRLLRVLKTGRLVHVRCEHVSGDRLRLALHSFMLLLLMFSIAHLLACLWYAVAANLGGNSWINFFGYENAGGAELYVVSLRWAFSQFSGGMDEIQPKTIREHLFSCIVFIFAFWSGAVLVSLITSWMTRFLIEGSQNNLRLKLLQHFLEQHRVSKGLEFRLTRNAQYALLEREKRVPEDAVEVIKLLSDPLRMELHFEIYSPAFAGHPFFVRYIDEHPHVMKQVCHKAMSTDLVSSGDIVFDPGERSENPRMIFLNHGSLSYTQPVGIPEDLLPGGWACEAVLWTRWETQGTLVALSDSRLHVLDARTFQTIAARFSDDLVCEYAAKFVDTLNGEQDLSDLPSHEERNCVRRQTNRRAVIRPTAFLG